MLRSAIEKLDDAGIESLVNEKAESLGFTTIAQVLEIEGTCHECGPSC